jgi:anti-sigma factor RsiW
MRLELTCREFVEFLGDYLSGELSPERLMVFNHHLSRCPSCVNYTNTYMETTRFGKTALRCDDGPVPADVPEELVRAILAATRWSVVTVKRARHPRR